MLGLACSKFLVSEQMDGVKQSKSKVNAEDDDFYHVQPDSVTHDNEHSGAQSFVDQSKNQPTSSATKKVNTTLVFFIVFIVLS